MKKEAPNPRNQKNFSLYPLNLKEALAKAMDAKEEPKEKATEEPKTEKK